MADITKLRNDIPITSAAPLPAASQTSEGWNVDFYDDSADLKIKSVPTMFQNPREDYINDMNEKNLIWIDITAVPIYKLTNNVRASKAFSEKNEYATKSVENQRATVLKNATWYRFKFLAQQELIETISHEWAPYESLASTIAGMYVGIGSFATQLEGLNHTFRTGSIKNRISKAFNAGKNFLKDKTVNGGLWEGVKGAASDMAKSGHVANYRVDTPLQYKNSNRREFELIFNLINTEEGKNHENVVLPVKLLEMLSSPSYRQNATENFNADILLPYLFTLRTTPGSLLTVDMAVLKGVNPTWRGPWIKGYPSRCELRLSFMEYKPLEQGNFYGQTENVIQTVMTGAGSRMSATALLEPRPEKDEKIEKVKMDKRPKNWIGA